MWGTRTGVPTLAAFVAKLQAVRSATATNSSIRDSHRSEARVSRRILTTYVVLRYIIFYPEGRYTPKDLSGVPSDSRFVTYKRCPYRAHYRFNPKMT
jgi:predicted Holliday junction resolvase-like endonuclease